MTKCSDMSSFKIIYVSGMLSCAIIIFLPEVNIMVIYLANCVFACSMVGWQTLGFLIAEIRVPPQSLGSIIWIGQTAGIAASCLVPFISQLEGEMPIALCAIYQTVVAIAVYALPKPGKYLPKLVG